MKVIDLLNKIANGEIPKKIIYDNKQWIYDEKLEDYITYDDSRIDWKYTIMEYINDEVEIIEEDKKIEKLDLILDEQFSNDELQAYIKETQEKVNEIIDYLEENK